jgi:tetratricopeptide (TPR) repeat protein
MEPIKPAGSSFPYWEDILNEGGLNIDVELEKEAPRSDSASSFVGSPIPTIIKHVSDPVISELQRRQFHQHVRAAQPSPTSKLSGPVRLERRHTDPGFKKSEVDGKMFHCFQLSKKTMSPVDDREAKMPKTHKLKPSVGRSSTPGSQEGDSFISLDPLVALQDQKPSAPLIRPIPRQLLIDSSPPHIKDILGKGQIYYLTPEIIHQLVEEYKITRFDVTCFNKEDNTRASYIHALTIDPDGRPCKDIRALIQNDIEKKTLVPKQVAVVLVRHLDCLFFLNVQEKEQIAECIKGPFDESLLYKLSACLISWARNDRLTQALALTCLLSFYHVHSSFLKVQMCEFFTWKGFYEEALKVAERILKKIPDQPYALVLKACCLLHRKDIDGAADAMIRYSKANAQCIYTMTLLVTIHSYLNDNNQVVESLDELIFNNPEYLFAIMLRAEFHYLKQHWANAKSDYMRIMTLCPKFEYVRQRIDFLENTYGSRKSKRELWPPQL